MLSDIGKPRQPISLILMDFQMPIKNGIEATREINKLYEFIDLKKPNNGLVKPEIVFLTAFKTTNFTKHIS